MSADYFCHPSGSSGDGSFANPWSLAEMVAATLSTGNRVAMIADAGDYVLGTSGVTIDEAAANGVQFFPVKSNGDFDPSLRFTIDATAVTSGAAVTISGSRTGVHGMIVNDCGGSIGVNVTGASCSFSCCEANRSTTIGFAINANAAHFSHCKAEDNGADGWSLSANDYCVFAHCAAIDNVGDGFACSSGSADCAYVRCVARGNNAVGIQVGLRAMVAQCTAYNNGSHGGQHLGEQNLNINFAAWDNGGFGIDYEDGGQPDLVVTPFIGLSGDANASGAYDAAGLRDSGVWDYTGIVVAALRGTGSSQQGATLGPVGGTANVASGTDLTPQVGSDMNDAGSAIPYTARGDNTIDSGAIESAGNAAAGGSLSPNILGVM